MAKKIRKIDTNTWIIIVALIIGFAGGFLLARAKYKVQISIISTMLMDKASQIDSLKSQTNRAMMVNGEMMEERDGIVSKMTTDMSLTDGTKVTMRGRVTKTDGTTSTLKNGESIMMNGSMMQ